MRETFMGLAAAGSAIFLAASAEGATLVADYGFQGSDPLASSVAGAPDLTILNPTDVSYTTQTVAGQMRQVVDIVPGGGLQAETDQILSNTNYSIVLLANFNAITTSTNNTELVLGKAIDFQNRTTDSGLYTAQGGGLDFYDGAGSDPTAEGTSLPGALGFGSYAQIVFTRATDGTTDAYIDGSLAFTFNDSDGQAIIGNGMLQQYLNFLIDDNANSVPFTRENEGGYVARIRLYDGVLSATDVANLDEIPEPASGLLICAGAMLLAPRRRRRIGNAADPT
jgi:hypothetical protein